MVTNEIRKVRCDDVLSLLSENGHAVFFTLTTPDECDYHQIRSRWRSFRHDFLRVLRKRGYKARYVMNYELHPGYLIKVKPDSKTVERVIHGDGRSHGWHIHGVVDCWLPYPVMRRFLNKAGFGRFDVRLVDRKGISDYLTKHALKAYRGLTRREREQYKGMRVRLVNASRGLPTLDSYDYKSAEIIARRIVKRDILLECYGSEKVDCVDHRIISSRADVCMRLGFQHDFQFLKFFENLYTMRRLEILKNENSQKCKNSQK